MKTGLLTTLTLCAAVAGQAALADTVDIREWLVPWEDSAPGNAYVDARGRVWFVGTRGQYIANFSPETEEFNRYDLRKGTDPVALLIDGERNLWYASQRRRHVGVLNPGTGRIDQLDMPDRKAKGLRALAFGPAGNIWFTAEDGNFVGRVRGADRAVDLVPVATRRMRPYGIAVNSRGIPWAAASGRNALLRVDPDSMKINEVFLPNEDARPLQIGVTSDDLVWFIDADLGQLGSYDPEGRVFRSWELPGGAESRPSAMTVDRNDRVWLIESGSDPNRLVAFDTRMESFVSTTSIPSGGGTIAHLHYSPSSGEIWFGTLTNYIGRARVH